MTKRFNCDAQKVDTGWIGYFETAERPERTYVCHKGDRIIFASWQEAKNAADDAFLAALNRSLIGGTINVVGAHKPTLKAAAERLFMGGGKIVGVERKARASA